MFVRCWLFALRLDFRMIWIKLYWPTLSLTPGSAISLFIRTLYTIHILSPNDKKYDVNVTHVCFINEQNKSLHSVLRTPKCVKMKIMLYDLLHINFSIMLHCRQNNEAIKQMKYIRSKAHPNNYQVPTTTDNWLHVMYPTLDENSLDIIL